MGRKLALVIGAGVAGCQAARALLRAGYDVLVLEQSRGVGGVWRRNYHGFALQVPWDFFTFPEFPYELAPGDLAARAEAQDFPSGEIVQEYIEAYCKHFKLDRHIMFGVKVVHIAALPQFGNASAPTTAAATAAATAAGGGLAAGASLHGGTANLPNPAGGPGTGPRWAVRFRQAMRPGQSPDVGELKTMECDVVVMATGMYFSPYVPFVQGMADYKGTVLHARDFNSLEPLKGKRVLVLGAGKSAHDCSVLAASEAAKTASVTTLFRQAHWPLPREIFGIPFHKIVYTRFTAAMLPAYYTAEGRLGKRVKHTLLSPLKRLFWGALERHVAGRMALRGHLRPERGFVQDLFFGGQIQDGSWNEAVNAGRIKAVRGSLAEVLPGGVRLTDGTVLDCDVMLFATGYTKDYSLFDAATASRLAATPGSSTEEGLHLYRSIMSPRVPGLFFIGSEASTFNNVLTSGLQSLWLLHLLADRIRLPSPTAINKDILDQAKWRSRVMPAQRHSSSIIMLYQQRYHEQLLKDMGFPTRRKALAAKSKPTPGPGAPPGSNKPPQTGTSATDAAAAANGSKCSNGSSSASANRGSSSSSSKSGPVPRYGGSELLSPYSSHDYAELFDDRNLVGLSAAMVRIHGGAATAAGTRSAEEIVASAVTLMPAAAAIGTRLDLAVLPGAHGVAAVAARAGGGLVPLAQSDGCGGNGVPLMLAAGADAAAAAAALVGPSRLGPGPAAAAGQQQAAGGGAQLCVGNGLGNSASVSAFVGSFDSPTPTVSDVMPLGRAAQPPSALLSAAAVVAAARNARVAAAGLNIPIMGPGSRPMGGAFFAAGGMPWMQSALGAAAGGDGVAAAAAGPSQGQLPPLQEEGGLPASGGDLNGADAGASGIAASPAASPSAALPPPSQEEASDSLTSPANTNTGTAASGAAGPGGSTREMERSMGNNLLFVTTQSISGAGGPAAASGSPSPFATAATATLAAAAGSAGGASPAQPAAATSSAAAGPGRAGLSLPAASSHGGNATGGRVSLSRRVRLQVLHLMHRSIGGSLVPASAGDGEILELRVPSGTNTNTNNPLTSTNTNAMATTGTGTGAAAGATPADGHTGGTGGGGGAGAPPLGATSTATTATTAHVSSSLCFEAMRNAAPNVYGELVGTLEVH
ncbi:hypothetical protein CHLRE_17g731700v5 [Chlamydomonas reinhardtii]|uniref:Flavin-containing monooxygenase n=1 Tax=Chlamydomonas reinhardtii TaxID=3055 RepID=A8JFE8_CHLRE|nr:uncharacterized protein CHLRE_17g731700v5 [Chlamydomonas reinhardtii]PNW70719.1 hypothetical protein CHLRE_17g731700v5 [Chlamydomonas reinhardtii]|eukprot:XP_001701533.1 flavin-containing monooxygenase [Chlamydomonas reinhardtii]